VAVAATREFMVELDSVTYSYVSISALNNVSFAVGGGVLGILGLNGAGKTTLLRLIATTLPLQRGEIAVAGVPVRRVLELRQKIGYLPQHFDFLKTATLRETLKYFAYLRRIAISHASIDAALDRVGLLDRARDRVGDLSGGMLRKLGLAQALLHDPPVLIVDEPSTGLDPEARVGMRRTLAELGERRTVLLSTHIAEDIEATTTNLLVLHSGRVRFHGRVSEFIAQATGSVWEGPIPQGELNQVVVSRTLEPGRFRYIAENPFPDARQVPTPSLEDAFLWMVQGS